MESPMTAIETTGTIDEHHQLHLDGKLPIHGPKRVKVIVLSPTDAEWDEMEWLQAAAHDAAFDFLNDPAEDIYTLEDGKSFPDKV